MDASERNSSRWSQRGTRPVRIANCSGANMDPGYQMLRQATRGDVDFITGDYLAEMNLAENAEAYAGGRHDGFEPTAWDGLQQSLEVIAEKRIKVIINGGALNPAGMARKTQTLAQEKGLGLKIGFVSGDDLLPEMRELLETTGNLPEHLDPEDAGIKLAKNAKAFLNKGKPLVSANAYLGARAIVKGLELGADIIICGRVSDASPVIGAAWYWHSWSEQDYDNLAGALVAGHLIECSAYVTGSNFSGFTDYDLDSLVDLSFGIAEVDADGSCVITKHEGTNGMVNTDTVLCQFLYELQGDIYLNSDVKAYISSITVEQVEKDRVRVSGIKGAPPPPTTKLAIFYKGGFQSEYLICATGYGTSEKYALTEKQIRFGLRQKNLLDSFDVLSFQHVGTLGPDANSQLRSTTYLRVFAQASNPEPLIALLKTAAEFGMQHYSGMHGSLDRRGALPKPFLAYYPALYPQDYLQESINMLNESSTGTETTGAGHPPVYQNLESRASYNTADPVDLVSFGPTRLIRLGDVCLARSGDKGANLNFGIYPRAATLFPTSHPLPQKSWSWLRSFLSRERMKALIGEDWKSEYALERVEFPRVMAVHFVVYGILGRGVSSGVGLDVLGKGFADWIRDRMVAVPLELVEGLRGRVKGLEEDELGGVDSG